MNIKLIMCLLTSQEGASCTHTHLKHLSSPTNHIKKYYEIDPNNNYT